MRARIYWGSKNARRYLLLPAELPDMDKVPSEILAQFGQLHFDREVDLDVAPPLIGAAVVEAKRQLRERCYHVGEFGIQSRET